MTDRKDFTRIMDRNENTARSAARFDADTFIGSPAPGALRLWCTQELRARQAIALRERSDATVWDGERATFVALPPTEKEVDALFGEMVGTLARFAADHKPKPSHFTTLSHADAEYVLYKTERSSGAALDSIAACVQLHRRQPYADEDLRMDIRSAVEKRRVRPPMHESETVSARGLKMSCGPCAGSGTIWDNAKGVPQLVRCGPCAGKGYR